MTSHRDRVRFMAGYLIRPPLLLSSITLEAAVRRWSVTMFYTYLRVGWKNAVGSSILIDFSFRVGLQFTRRWTVAVFVSQFWPSVDLVNRATDMIPLWGSCQPQIYGIIVIELLDFVRHQSWNETTSRHLPEQHYGGDEYPGPIEALGDEIIRFSNKKNTWWPISIKCSV